MKSISRWDAGDVSTYWMSEAAIPGGIAFENFELVEPFRQGRAFTFRVEPLA